ncbi:ribonuclease domain-containing protein [Kitasatospora sp. NBC_01266]|uniref:ribonuclease domain-containing protein n=1 Tax=Kitasatospora sp. NBC_01266 TaxID=2903572 RepID=UPI002E374761|nr:ribonuclease domain-containing protein [Kitasatospora sp. NBC_01266]
MTSLTSRFRLITVAAALLCTVAAAAGCATDRQQPAAVARSGSVCQSRLPGQARDTLKLIGSNGPFPYRTDGVVFENREKRLPAEPSGYYHEYTVVTPGSGDRGTRRIVTGKAGEEYWTADHYSSFQRIDTGC